MVTIDNDINGDCIRHSERTNVSMIVQNTRYEQVKLSEQWPFYFHNNLNNVEYWSMITRVGAQYDVQ